MSFPEKPVINFSSQLNNLEEEREISLWPGEIAPYSESQKKEANVFFQKMWGQLGREWNPKKLQTDLVDIPASYQKEGGNFWLAQQDKEVVGCIGLKPLGE